MNATDLTNDFEPVAGGAEARPPLRVVIVYGDRSAGQQAMGLVHHLGTGLGGEISFETVPWAFDSLADPGWRAAAANDGLRADIVVIASSAAAGPLPPPVAEWAETVIRRKRGTSAAIVPLFLADRQPDGEDSPRLTFLRQLAEDYGLQCIAPARAGRPPGGATPDSPSARAELDDRPLHRELQTQPSLDSATAQRLKYVGGRRYSALND